RAAKRHFRDARPDRRFPRRQVLGLLGEPPVEIGAAAIAERHWPLIMAFGVAARAGEPDMEMIIVSPPRANAFQPGAIGAGLAAQGALDGRVDEDALDLRGTGKGFEQTAVLRLPDSRIDIAAVRPNDIGGGQVVALGCVEP